MRKSQTTQTGGVTLTPQELEGLGGLKWNSFPKGTVAAWVADMDFAMAPSISQVVRDLANKSAFVYQRPDDAVSLAQAFGLRMERDFGWRIEREHTVEVTDLLQAMTALIFAFTAQDGRVALFTPAYPGFFRCIEEAGRAAVELPLIVRDGSFDVDFKGLAEAFSQPDVSLFLLCNPHNPTGKVFSLAELQRVGELAREHDVLVISDEVHADIVFSGSEHIPFELSHPSANSSTVTLHSPSKAFNLASLRCAVMYFGSASLQDQFFARLPRLILGKVGELSRAAAAAAWQPDTDLWLENVLSEISERRQEIVEASLAWAPRAKLLPPQATYFAWIDCRRLDTGELNPMQFFLENAKVALSDGGLFGEGYEKFVRLNFATSREVMSTTLKRMNAVLIGS